MIRVKPLSGALGAEISGVDLSAPIDETTKADIIEAFHTYLVLLFRQQSLSAAQQVAFTEWFGAVEPHPLRTRRNVDGYPGVLILENQPGKPGARNDYWHSDISHEAKPPLGSVLHALEVPEGRGDTMFCNMYTAYQQLSDGLKQLLDGVGAVHSAEATLRRNNSEHNDGLPINKMPEPCVHPVFRTHPQTGRKALYVNPHFTTHLENMSAAESVPLLNYLYSVATRPENIYRHRWQAGDVLMWDNRCAMHYAVLDYSEHERRLMHRTTAAGEAPY